MPWKKAWPTQVKDQLKTMGLKDKDIVTLEGYGSLAILKAKEGEWKVAHALNDAKAKQLYAILEGGGVV
jgi:hypothetical protein